MRIVGSRGGFSGTHLNADVYFNLQVVIVVTLASVGAVSC
jgi:hypothetical protein